MISQICTAYSGCGIKGGKDILGLFVAQPLNSVGMVKAPEESITLQAAWLGILYAGLFENVVIKPLLFSEMCFLKTRKYFYF